MGSQRESLFQQTRKALMIMTGVSLVLLVLVIVLGIRVATLSSKVDELMQNQTVSESDESSSAEESLSSEELDASSADEVGGTVGEATTEEPTEELTEEPTTETPEQYIVCLDAGHGGKHGATSPLDGRHESDDTLRLTLAIQRELSKYENVTIVMTRTEDVDVDNGVRAEIANDAGADLFVSIHRNSNASGDKGGIEGWIHSSDPADSREVGEMILAAMERVGVTANYGVKAGTWDDPTANYKVLRLAEMPAVLLEVGYLNYAKDNELFDTNLDAYAKAAADAIYAWLTKE